MTLEKSFFLPESTLFHWEDETVNVFFEFQCLLSGCNKAGERIMRTLCAVHKDEV